MSDSTVKVMIRPKTSTVTSGRISLSYLFPSVAFFIFGSLLQFLAYSNLEPLIVGIIFLVLGVVFLQITRTGGHYELKAFLLVFSICWFWAGVAAIYAEYYKDYFQLHSDAWDFYVRATRRARGLSVEELRLMTEGSAMVVIWRAVYDFFASLGFDKGRYIGVTVNVSMVSMTAVIAVKIVKEMFGDDAARLNRIILLFSLCGLFWLFAAIHLRDAAVLLFVTSLTYFWVRYLTKPRVTNLIWLVGASIAGFTFLGFLRQEFVFVPVAMLGAALIPIWFYSSARGTTWIWIYAVAFLTLVTFSYWFITLESEVVSTLTRSYELYRNPNADSLGSRFIVNAPIPIRLILGSAYLYVFPIPFWGGLLTEQAHFMFKSCNAIYMYVVTPLILLGMMRIAGKKVFRTSPIVFLLILSIGFTLAIAGTSLQTRHFGAFLVPILVLATVPDLTNRKEKTAFRGLVVVYISIMMIVHLSWAMLKFG